MNNDVTSGYIITDVERLRQPMQTITHFLLGAMKMSVNPDIEVKTTTLRRIK
jgi:hypothetical protein